MHEKLYPRELTRRCCNVGLDVVPEMKITVSLDDFSKDYDSDHLINRGVIVESKPTSSMTSAHKGQALNDLLLWGLHHATLLNFRPERVQHEFVSTSLTQHARRQFTMVTDNWCPFTVTCHEFPGLLRRLLDEWEHSLTRSSTRRH